MINVHDDRSVLDDLGAEVTGIAAPVSLCMAITIFLVRVLRRDDDDDGQKIVLAEAIYSEKV
jgi:presenilin 1